MLSAAMPKGVVVPQSPSNSAPLHTPALLINDKAGAVFLQVSGRNVLKIISNFCNISHGAQTFMQDDSWLAEFESKARGTSKRYVREN